MIDERDYCAWLLELDLVTEWVFSHSFIFSAGITGGPHSITVTGVF